MLSVPPPSQEVMQSRIRERERQLACELALVDTSTSPRRTRLSSSVQALLALLVVLLLVIGMLFWFHLL